MRTIFLYKFENILKTAQHGEKELIHQLKLFHKIRKIVNLKLDEFCSIYIKLYVLTYQ